MEMPPVPPKKKFLVVFIFLYVPVEPHSSTYQLTATVLKHVWTWSCSCIDDAGPAPCIDDAGPAPCIDELNN